jgi:hypothetical protein
MKNFQLFIMRKLFTSIGDARLLACLEWGGLFVQVNDYNIGICYFSALHAAFRSKNKDWSARNHKNVSKWRLAPILFSEPVKWSQMQRVSDIRSPYLVFPVNKIDPKNSEKNISRKSLKILKCVFRSHIIWELSKD